MTQKPIYLRVWPYVLAAVVILILAATALTAIFLRRKAIDERLRIWMVEKLSDRFDSQIDLDRLHISVVVFPEFLVTGQGLTVHYHNRTDVPPLIHIEKFSFHIGLGAILRAPHHIALIHLQNMVLTIPPRGEHTDTEPPKNPGSSHGLPAVMIDKILCNDTHLFMMPKKEGKQPLDFEIHDLVLNNVTGDKPFAFHGNLTNAKPVGEIATNGMFGPWDAEEPGNTPVTGKYTFTHADLNPFPGIGGILSSTGGYQGPLNDLAVNGETDTSDFSLDPVQSAVPLHTDYSATVDGTNGNTYLHPVRATLLHSIFIANGSVVKAPNNLGHTIALDVVSENARMEDVLRLATKGKPFLTGPLNLKTKLLLSPGHETALEKLKLDGTFRLTNGQWASADVREKLESFSRHAEGQPKNEDAGSSISDLKGEFHLDHGTVTFKNLTFAIPGATVELQGTYGLKTEQLNFTGDLRMQAKLSQMVTGAKSFFLKAVDPFFAKNGAGTLLPLTITGTRSEPVMGVTVFHKTIKKKIGEETGSNSATK